LKNCFFLDILKGRQSRIFGTLKLASEWGVHSPPLRNRSAKIGSFSKSEKLKPYSNRQIWGLVVFGHFSFCQKSVARILTVLFFRLAVLNRCPKFDVLCFGFQKKSEKMYFFVFCFLFFVFYIFFFFDFDFRDKDFILRDFSKTRERDWELCLASSFVGWASEGFGEGWRDLDDFSVFRSWLE